MSDWMLAVEIIDCGKDVQSAILIQKNPVRALWPSAVYTPPCCAVKLNTLKFYYCLQRHYCGFAELNRVILNEVINYERFIVKFAILGQ